MKITLTTFILSEVIIVRYIFIFKLETKGSKFNRRLEIKFHWEFCENYKGKSDTERIIFVQEINFVISKSSAGQHIPNTLSRHDI